MAKDPLITRSELRKRREQEVKQQIKQEKQEIKQSEKEYKKKEKEISSFYRKENKKNKPITKTRTGEQIKMRERNTFLNKAIFLVIVILIIVALFVFFI